MALLISLRTSPEYGPRSVDFKLVASNALTHVHTIVGLLLPDGRRANTEWEALNPVRNDQRPGSFKISLQTGLWADFATGDAGGDLISLAAYVRGTSQYDAALWLQDILQMGDVR